MTKESKIQINDLSKQDKFLKFLCIGDVDIAFDQEECYEEFVYIMKKLYQDIIDNSDQKKFNILSSVELDETLFEIQFNKDGKESLMQIVFHSGGMSFYWKPNIEQLAELLYKIQQ